MSSEQKLLAWLAKHPEGASSGKAAAECLHRSVKHTRVVLGELRKAGSVCWIAAGRAALGRWTLAANKDRTEAFLAAEREAERVRVYWRHIERCRRYNERMRTGDWHDDGRDDWPVERRIVAASDAPRLEVKAPASVWQLGAMA